MTVIRKVDDLFGMIDKESAASKGKEIIADLHDIVSGILVAREMLMRNGEKARGLVLLTEIALLIDDKWLESRANWVTNDDYNTQKRTKI